jgi:hypothetical protein
MKLIVDTFVTKEHLLNNRVEKLWSFMLDEHMNIMHAHNQTFSTYQVNTGANLNAWVRKF